MYFHVKSLYLVFIQLILTLSKTFCTLLLKMKNTLLLKINNAKSVSREKSVSKLKTWLNLAWLLCLSKFNPTKLSDLECACMSALIRGRKWKHEQICRNTVYKNKLISIGSDASNIPLSSENQRLFRLKLWNQTFELTIRLTAETIHHDIFNQWSRKQILETSYYTFDVWPFDVWRG